MMYSLPFYPHFPPKRYSYYPHSINAKTTGPTSMRKSNNFFNNHSHNIYNHKGTNNLTETSVSSQKDDTIFEIFGIKLHSDDILLICLIFFLFKEGVQDEYLFISLILLLLS